VPPRPITAMACASLVPCAFPSFSSNSCHNWGRSVKVGTVAKGTETQRLGRAATVGCGERLRLAESVLENCPLRRGSLTSSCAGHHILLDVELGCQCCSLYCGSLCLEARGKIIHGGCGSVKLDQRACSALSFSITMHNIMSSLPEQPSTSISL
jgi:hypothetical protein